jgi:hypothetical protein
MRRMVSYSWRRGRDIGKLFDHSGMKAREGAHIAQLLDLDQPSPHAIVDVVIVVGDGIGEDSRAVLPAQAGCVDEPLADVSQLACVRQRAVLENAFPALEREVQPGEAGVSLFEFVHHAQRLQVVFEAAVLAHAGIERVLAGVPERRMPEVVRQADGLGECFVDPQGPRHGTPDLRHLERMRDPRPVEIALVIHEHLGLVDQAAEGVGMDDPVAIPLEFAAECRRRFRKSPAATLLVDRGIRRERLTHRLPATRPKGLAQRGVLVVAGHHGLANALEQHEPDAARQPPSCRSSSSRRACQRPASARRRADRRSRGCAPRVQRLPGSPSPASRTCRRPAACRRPRPRRAARWCSWWRFRSHDRRYDRGSAVRVHPARVHRGRRSRP